MVELTGTQSKLDAFLNLLGGYDILELARTGITGSEPVAMKDVTLIDQDGNVDDTHTGVILYGIKRKILSFNAIFITQ